MAELSGEDPAALAAFAEELAVEARRETLRWWAEDWTAEDKSGGGAFDPVTEADRGAEAAMRRLIEARYPEHGIAGEEFPERPAQGRYSWSLDPVDGTRAFVCGLPSWTTLIALLEDGRPVAGIIDAPRLDELCAGSAAGTEMVTAAGRRPLRVSGCTRIADARLSTTDPFLFGQSEAESFDRVRRRARLTRYGLDGYAYGRLAAGALDLVIESGLKPHDYNALLPVVRGAGGWIGDWRGGEDFSGGAIVAAASRELYDETVELLSR